MEIHDLKQRWALDAGLSLAHPSFWADHVSVKKNAGFNKESECSSSGSEDQSSLSFSSQGLKKRKRDLSAAKDFKKIEWSCADEKGRGFELIDSEPLPHGWEQCLDLESGTIYYKNLHTKVRTKQDPRQYATQQHVAVDAVLKEIMFIQTARDQDAEDKIERKDQGWKSPLLDLSLNLSSPTSSCGSGNPAQFPKHEAHTLELLPHHHKKKHSAMVALACRHCLMFVMLSKASPKCPNCGTTANV